MSLSRTRINYVDAVLFVFNIEPYRNLLYIQMYRWSIVRKGNIFPYTFCCITRDKGQKLPVFTHPLQIRTTPRPMSNRPSTIPLRVIYLFRAISLSLNIISQHVIVTTRIARILQHPYLKKTIRFTPRRI